MEFKTSCPLPIPGTGSRFDAFLFVLGVLLVLLRDDRDAASPAECRLASAFNCVKAVLAAIIRLRHRRSTRHD